MTTADLRTSYGVVSEACSGPTARALLHGPALIVFMVR